MREELAALEARSAQLEPGTELDGVLEEYARVIKRYEHVDGYNYEAFIKRVLIGLVLKKRSGIRRRSTFPADRKPG